MQAATGMGAMAAAGFAPAEAGSAIEPYGGRLSLAAVNGPSSVVLSGRGPALARCSPRWRTGASPPGGCR